MRVYKRSVACLDYRATKEVSKPVLEGADWLQKLYFSIRLCHCPPLLSVLERLKKKKSFLLTLVDSLCQACFTHSLLKTEPSCQACTPTPGCPCSFVEARGWAC